VLLYLAINIKGIIAAQADSVYPKGGYAEISRKAEHNAASMRSIVDPDGFVIFRSISYISFRCRMDRDRCGLLLAYHEL